MALVDADGVSWATAVVPAGTQDRDCLEALSGGKAAWPSLRVALLNGALTAERCRDWCHRHGMRHRVVERAPGQRGFVVVEKCRVVERSFGALVDWGGLSRPRAGRLDVAAARLAAPSPWPAWERSRIQTRSCNKQPERTQKKALRRGRV